MIDEKVREIVAEGLEKAKDILTKNMKALQRLAETLLKYETLTGAEIADVIEGRAVRETGEPPKKRKTKTKSDESLPPVGGEPTPQV
jgi:cell division protease FtsH